MKKKKSLLTTKPTFCATNERVANTLFHRAWRRRPRKARSKEREPILFFSSPLCFPRLFPSSTSLSSFSSPLSHRHHLFLSSFSSATKHKQRHNPSILFSFVPLLQFPTTDTEERHQKTKTTFQVKKKKGEEDGEDGGFYTTTCGSFFYFQGRRSASQVAREKKVDEGEEGKKRMRRWVFFFLSFPSRRWWSSFIPG